MNMDKLMKFSKYVVLPIIPLLFILSSCSSDEKKENDKILTSICQKQAASLSIEQLINQLLIYAMNDTTKVCYSLVMPKQSLKRLVTQDTYPKNFTMKKASELFVKVSVNGIEYMDSCAEDTKDSKDWLIDNSVNEPINPIWEQITEER